MVALILARQLPDVNRSFIAIEISSGSCERVMSHTFGARHDATFLGHSLDLRNLFLRLLILSAVKVIHELHCAGIIGI